MSFLESGKARFSWVAAQPKTSIRPEAGCVQCGSSLDASAVINLSGKCQNCESWVSDEEESFEDLED